MNIFNKVTLQSMKKNRTRTIVTIIGVVLSAAMITAVATFGVSLLDYMAKGAAAKYGDWHVAFLDVDSSFVAKQASNDKVASTVKFENIGYAKLDGGKNPNKPYLFISGFSKETFDALPVTLLSGRLPENSGEILVSGKTATIRNSVRMIRIHQGPKRLYHAARKLIRLSVFVGHPFLRKTLRRDIL